MCQYGLSKAAGVCKKSLSGGGGGDEVECQQLLSGEYLPNLDSLSDPPIKEIRWFIGVRPVILPGKDRTP